MKEKLLKAMKDKKIQKFPDGGEVAADDFTDLTPDQASEKEPDQAEPEESPTEEVASAPPAETQPSIPPKPENMPSAGTIDVVGNLPPAENALQKTAEHMAYANDLNAGLIHPKTYQDLFSKNSDGSDKSTLGKLGTMFGLLVSGAGSGLSHQPNMLVDMMNKEIERDLESQKMNQSNKLNWYNAAMAHEKTLADIELTNAHTNAINTGAWDKTEEAKLRHWKNNLLPGMLDDAATTDALNMMHISNVQMRQEQVNKMPPGPAKAAAQNMIDTVLKPSAMQRIQHNNQAYAARKGLRDQQNPNPLKGKDQPIDPRGPAINEKKYNDMMLRGFNDSPDPTTSVNAEEARAIDGERAQMEENRNHYADYLDNFKALKQMRGAGQVPFGGALNGIGTGIGGAIGAAGGPMSAALGTGIGNALGHAGTNAVQAFEQQRSSYIEGLKQLIGNDKSEDDKIKLVNSIMPTWSSTDEDDDVKLKQGTQYFRSNKKEFATVSQKKGLKVPFPAMNFVSKKEKPKAISNTEMMNTNAHSGL